MAKNTSTHSGYIENLIEHVYISEILETAWLNDELQIEIARAEIDNSGYDLILECNNIIRHVQLKSSEINSKTAKQYVNIKLAEKPNGCIIWITYDIDKTTSRFTLDYSFFGTYAGGKLPDISNFRTVKHSKGDSKGEKKEHPNIKVIPKSKFEKNISTKKLLKILFNV